MTGSFDPRDSQVSVFDALIAARAKYGAKKPILEGRDR